MKILIFNYLNLFVIQSFYSNSYNPFIKDDEGKIIISEEERFKKENELKEQFLNELVIQFKNYAPDFNLDTVSQSEKYLDILLVLKEIQEFAISTNIKKTFEFNIRNFDETCLEKIEIHIQLIIKHLSDTVELLSKINNPIKEKDIYYQINILNKLLKDLELIKN